MKLIIIVLFMLTPFWGLCQYEEEEEPYEQDEVVEEYEDIEKENSKESIRKYFESLEHPSVQLYSIKKSLEKNRNTILTGSIINITVTDSTGVQIYETTETIHPKPNAENLKTLADFTGLKTVCLDPNILDDSDIVSLIDIIKRKPGDITKSEYYLKIKNLRSFPNGKYDGTIRFNESKQIVSLSSDYLGLKDSTVYQYDNCSFASVTSFFESGNFQDRTYRSSSREKLYKNGKLISDNIFATNGTIGIAKPQTIDYKYSATGQIQLITKVTELQSSTTQFTYLEDEIIVNRKRLTAEGKTGQFIYHFKNP